MLLCKQIEPTSSYVSSVLANRIDNPQVINTIPKHNEANSKKGKGQSKRASYTVKQRFYACYLRDSGKSPMEIGTLLKEKYGLDLQSSTLSTFYNKKNMVKYKKECHRYT